MSNHCFVSLNPYAHGGAQKFYSATEGYSTSGIQEQELIRSKYKSERELLLFNNIICLNSK